MRRGVSLREVLEKNQSILCVKEDRLNRWITGNEKFSLGRSLGLGFSYKRGVGIVFVGQHKKVLLAKRSFERPSKE